MRTLAISRWSAYGVLALLALTACGDDKSPTDPGKDDPPKPTTITLSKSAHSFAALGDSTRLTATVKDQRGTAMEGASIDWASTDTAVVRVNASGWVQSVGVGTANVVASSGALADTAAVEVEQVPAELVVSPDSVALVVGDTARLAATVWDANGVEVAGADVAWTSIDTTLAAVDSAGVVTGVAAGGTRVVARAGVTVDTVVVTIAEEQDTVIVPPVPASLVIEPDTIELFVGDVTRIDARVADAKGGEIADAPVTWESEDETIAVVDEEGRVTGAAPGETVVIASLEEFADTVLVLVRRKPTGIEIAPTSLDFDALEDTLSLNVVVRDADAVEIEDAVVAWSSTDPTVAGVDDEGKVWSVSNGTALIIAAAGPVADTIEVAVAQAPVSLVVPSGTMKVGEGEPALLEAALVDRKGIPVEGAVLAFESLDESIAKVDATGLVTGIRRGAETQVRVTATTFTRMVPVRVMDQILLVSVSQIYRINEDGSGVKQLTNVGANSAPVWAPDGSRILFQSNRDGNDEIYVMGPDGGGQANLTKRAGSDRAPVWSPDGTKIAFQGTSGGRTHIYVMNANGTDLTPLTTAIGDHSKPSWSTLDRIAFVSTRDNDWEIYAMNADGNDQDRLTNRPGLDDMPRWSPDGTKIIYEVVESGIYSLYVMDADGTNPTRLADMGTSHTFGHYQWSPDGSKIVFVANGKDLTVINADGTGATVLPTDATVVQAPVWTPDGDEILFTGVTSVSGAGGLKPHLISIWGGGPTVIDAGLSGVSAAIWRPRP